MIRRIGQCALPVLLAFDLFACTLWLSLLYPFGLADRPTGRQTISCYVGKAEATGTRWGGRMAGILNWIAMRFGDAPDHCRRSYEFWQRIEP